MRRAVSALWSQLWLDNSGAATTQQRAGPKAPQGRTWRGPSTDRLRPKFFFSFLFFDEYIFFVGGKSAPNFVSRGLDPRNRWESRNCERLNCVHGLVWPTLCAKGGVCPRLIGRSGGGGSWREAAGGWMCQEPDHWATRSASPQLPNVPGQDDNDRTSSPCLLSW